MTARADATCCSIPTPPRQTGSSPPSAVDEPLAPARRERRRRAAEEPGARLRRERVHHHERVHPAAVGGGDQEVAAAREVLLAGRPDPEPEDAEEDEPADQPEEPVRGRRLRLRGPAEPGEPLDGAARAGGERLRGDRGPVADGAVSSLADDPGPPCQVPAGSGRSGSGRGRRRVRARSLALRRRHRCFVTGGHVDGSSGFVGSARRRSSSASARRHRRIRRRRLVVVVDRRRRPRRLDRPPERAPRRALGMARRIVERVARAVAPGQDQRAPGRRTAATRSARSGPRRRSSCPARNVSSDEADDAVPDEEEQDQVAGAQPLRAWNPSQIRTSAPSSPDSDSYRNSGWKRVVSNGNVVARVGGDPMGAVDRDAPRQRRRRAVQLLVEEVAPAGDGLHHEQARARRCPPSAGTGRPCSARRGTPRSVPVAIPP